MNLLLVLKLWVLTELTHCIIVQGGGVIIRYNDKAKSYPPVKFHIDENITLNHHIFPDHHINVMSSCHLQYYCTRKLDYEYSLDISRVYPYKYASIIGHFLMNYETFLFLFFNYSK